MSFVSLEFILFVLLVSFLYYVFPKKHQWIVLLLANIYFYLTASSYLSVFLLLSIISIYFGGKLLSKLDNQEIENKKLDKEIRKIKKVKIKKTKKLILVIIILINLGFLAVLKYNNFFIGIINTLTGIFKVPQIPFVHFIMPLGISYYTLEVISYIVDVYYGKYECETNFFRLALYLTFFPLMVEGPITRYSEVKNQFIEQHSFDYDKYKNGIVLILWGFIKKLVIADQAAIFVDKAFSMQAGNIVVVASMILYTIQIYAEFSGCMDIVKGVASLFGIKLSDNFKQPFFSKTIEEFWRRWHITLGTFLRDYIFYPISVSKMNLKLSIKVRKWKFSHLAKFVTIAFPLFFVWFINGLWHGPSIKYIVYGLYYYVLMMLGVLLKPLFDKIVKIFNIKTDVFSFKLFRIIRTTIIVIIGMTIFRADSLSNAFNIFKSIFSTISVPLFGLGVKKSGFVVIFVGVIAMFIVDLLSFKKINIIEKIDEQNLYFKWSIYLIELFTLLIFGLYGSGYNPSSFIYGGF